MKKTQNISIIFSILFIASSCVAIFEDGKEMAADARTRISEITVDSLKAKIERYDEFYLIDIRQYKEYKQGSIDGAFNIPRGEIEFKISSEEYWEIEFFYPPLDTDKIIVYCKKGSRGALAAEALLKLGYKNVQNLKGGWLEFNPDFEP